MEGSRDWATQGNNGAGIGGLEGMGLAAPVYVNIPLPQGGLQQPKCPYGMQPSPHCGLILVGIWLASLELSVCPRSSKIA